MNRTAKRHRCMRCGEEFACEHGPGDCAAQYDVMPNVIRRNAQGEPEVVPHCPETPTWEYVRARIARERAAVEAPPEGGHVNGKQQQAVLHASGGGHMNTATGEPVAKKNAEQFEDCLAHLPTAEQVAALRAIAEARDALDAREFAFEVAMELGFAFPASYREMLARISQYARAARRG